MYFWFLFLGSKNVIFWANAHFVKWWLMKSVTKQDKCYWRSANNASARDRGLQSIDCSASRTKRKEIWDGKKSKLWGLDSLKDLLSRVWSEKNQISVFDKCKDGIIGDNFDAITVNERRSRHILDDQWLLHHLGMLRVFY